ncbi:APC family permease [Streptomyces winkii]|uniref:APC family permease n=1 Tax=Streptomyces winkii TaxID=3051178 RepID=UPI0028D5DC30|nr:APC family permease [Streptomyces sp. DSM 40971]
MPAPNPAAIMPALTSQQIRTLRQVGRQWGIVAGDARGWREALPADPGLTGFPSPRDVTPGRFGRFVVVPGAGPGGGTDRVEAVPASGARSLLARASRRARLVVLGAPLRSTALVRERMRKLVALPVLSADALSSIAYGPEAMLAVLVLAGTAGLDYSLPIAAVIVLLMFSLGISYRQTVRAYPHGGGSYIVASDNLGRLPGLVAAAGLMTDYILTVAVSVASCMAAVTSAMPGLLPYTVPLGLGAIALLLAGNLRGVRQAGMLFAAPTYLFLAAVFAVVVTGFFQSAERGFHPVPPHLPPPAEGVGLLLVARAFASGSTAMTGIEAVSNAVPAFQPVEWRNARTTLTWMVGFLITLFAGVMVLVHLTGVVPVADETVLSQLAGRSFGGGPLYAVTQLATAAILLLAANTAFNDFPRVLFFLARDHHAPRAFLRMGDRLAFTNGILVLAVTAALIFTLFGGNLTSLIPLYAVGVFLAFTLSQSGMVVHWNRLRTANWRRSLAFNATGCVLSATVLVTAVISKFAAGAWLAIVIVGLLITLMMRVRHHYDHVAHALALHPHRVEVPQSLAPPRSRTRAPSPRKRGEAVTGEEPEAGTEEEEVEEEGEDEDDEEVEEVEEAPEEIRHLAVIPVGDLDRAAMRTLAYVASLQQPALAVHISPTEEEAERFQEYWQVWGDHLPLEVVVSPYRAIVAPLVSYIESLHYQCSDVTVTVIIPEIAVRHRRHRLLHSHLAARLRRALRPLPKMVITTVPFHV